MRARYINEEFGQKDLVRMQDIRTKADGDPSKEISLATTQAKIIKDAGKAAARGEAAEQVFGKNSEISNIFFDRVRELGGSGRGVASNQILAPITKAPEKGEKLEREFKKGFILPSDRIAGDVKKQGGFQRGLGSKASLGVGIYSKTEEWEDKWVGSYGRWGGDAILPLGYVNLSTGKCDYFNVFDTWGDNDTTAELWKTSAGKLKLVFTSGNEPLYKLGNRNNFKHDQTGRSMFEAQLIDYVPLEHLNELIRKYKVSSISGYTYK